MKRKWEVRRSLDQRTDGQRRWDIAYQRLLQWTQAVAAGPDQGPAPITTQEVNDESRHLCPCLDPTPTTEPDH